jgi:hypothetical protein
MLDWCGFATFLFDAVTRLDAVTRRSRHFPSLISVSCLLAATVPPQYAATCPSQLPNSGSFVYVSTNGFDSSSCGSAEVGACLTLQQAVNRCNGAPNCVVVAQHGIYSVSTPVTISHQIQLFGSCRFTGESPNRYRTIVKGLPAFSIASNGAPVKLVGFTILANDAPAGSASIAMTVDKSNLSLDQTVIVSGTGGAGSPGVKGADGKPGVRGNNATVPQFGADGGPAVACADPGHTISGYGGAGAPYQVVDSTGGETHTTCTPVNSSIAQKGGDAPGAGGGKGGTNGGAGCDCVGGVSGNTNTPDGKQGDLGGLGPPSVTGGSANTDVLGQFRGLTWMPGAVGGTGNWGLPGGGGGGGGAGGFASVEIPTHHNDYEGMPGGGGGSGGCGGLGGTGGTPGGASFPIVFRSSVFVNSGANIIVPGPGGTGGHGGLGGSGTVGGGGGAGLTGHQTQIDGWYGDCSGTAPGSGGPGNTGGTGGAASGGAGGNGGPSFALVQVNAGSFTTPSWTYYAAQPGPGGVPGDTGGGNGPAAAAHAGQPGASGEVHSYSAIGAEPSPPPHIPHEPKKPHRPKKPQKRHHQPNRTEHEHEK